MAMREKCKMVVKNGTHLLTMPNGDVVPGQVFSRVTDAIGEQAYAIVKVWVDLKNSKDV